MHVVGEEYDLWTWNNRMFGFRKIRVALNLLNADWDMKLPSIYFLHDRVALNVFILFI